MNPQLLRILYVDDDRNDLALFALAIEETDLDIWLYTATEVRQAIAHLMGEGAYADRSLFPVPDLILLDLNLPRMSGFDFLVWCKQYPIAAPPVIVLSSSLRPADKELALAKGAADYMEKPLGLAGLRLAAARIWKFGMDWKRSRSRLSPSGWPLPSGASLPNGPRPRL